jgi:IS30 family transposase
MFYTIIIAQNPHKRKAFDVLVTIVFVIYFEIFMYICLLFTAFCGIIIDDLEKEFGTHFKNIFKTITFDNGSEFSTSTEMEKDGRTSVYYAHPYSSWERGTNENWNGIVRRFIPKGSSFEYLQKEDIERVRCYINTLPRKRFGYKTPMDLWRDEISAIMTA